MQPGNLLFIPVGVAAGMIGSALGRKLFDAAWSRVAAGEVPDPEHRDASWGELTIALALEGALSRLSEGLVEHGARAGFLRATGSWPGEERPEPG